MSRDALSTTKDTSHARAVTLKVTCLSPVRKLPTYYRSINTQLRSILYTAAMDIKFYTQLIQGLQSSKRSQPRGKHTSEKGSFKPIISRSPNKCISHAPINTMYISALSCYPGCTILCSLGEFLLVFSLALPIKFVFYQRKNEAEAHLEKLNTKHRNGETREQKITGIELL